MIKCDVSVNQQRGGSGPVLSEEKVCHLVYFPLVCCLFQPIGRDDNKKILRRPRLTADLPPNPPRDHKALGTTFFSRRERSRSYSLCVNDGSLVIPSHVCSDFGFAYTHRHKSNSPSPPLLSVPNDVSSSRTDIGRRSDTELALICAIFDTFVSHIFPEKQVPLQQNSH